MVQRTSGVYKQAATYRVTGMSDPKPSGKIALPILAYWLAVSVPLVLLICLCGSLFPLSLMTFLIITTLLLACQGIMLHFLVVAPLAKASRLINSSNEPSGVNNVTLEGIAGGEILRLVEDVAQMMKAWKVSYAKQMQSTRTDLADAVSKDIQDKFINRVVRSLSICSSSTAVGQKIIHHLENEFDSLLCSTFTVRVQSPLSVDICAHSGLSEAGLAVASLSHSEWAVKLKNLQEIKAAELRDVEKLGLGVLAPKDIDARFYQFLVAEIDDTAFFLCVFVQAKDTIRRPKFERTVGRLIESCQGMVQLILRFEKEFMEARRDALTKLANLKSLHEFFQEFKSVEQSSSVSRAMSMVLFDCDNFMDLNATQGKTTTDSVITTMSSVIFKVIPPSKNGRKKIFGDCVYRVGACKFLLLLEDVPPPKVMEMAERGRAAIEGFSGWPGGLPSLSVTVAVASYPEQAGRMEDLFSEVELCVDFVRSQAGSNCVIGAARVPASYRQKKQRRVLDGDAAFFEPKEMVNSIALAGKTGLLTITEQGGRQGWIYFNKGNPEKAGSGRLLGLDGVMEIMSSYDTSNFRFQAYSELSAEQLDRISGTGLEHCTGLSLEDLQSKAAEAESQLRHSILAISSPELYFLPTAESQNDDLWQKLQRSISVEEVETMRKILRMASGSNTFKDVIGRMQDIPSYRLWRAGALLVNNKMIKFTKLKVSSGIQQLR